jgi:hypothetical protein
LLIKALWRLANEEESLWVKIVKAKYIPRSCLWDSKRTYKCTPFWRNSMALRGKLLPLMSYKIGNGESCLAIGQPWFPGAMDCIDASVGDRKLRVRDLVDEENGGWDFSQLVQLFGYTNSVLIASNISPPQQSRGEDVLLFNLATNGRYSVKKMYNELNCSWRQIPTNPNTVWKKIWKFGSIQPRVRLFIWKLVKSALPLAKIIADRTGMISPLCAVCCQYAEDSVHMAFKCPFARSCWIASQLPLRTDQLPDNILLIITHVLEWATADQFTVCVHIVGNLALQELQGV